MMPEALVKDLSADERRSVLLWWSRLSEEERAQLTKSFDPRNDQIDLTPADDWQQLPIELSSPVDEEAEIERKMRFAQRFDYIVEHADQYAIGFRLFMLKRFGSPWESEDSYRKHCCTRCVRRTFAQ